MNHVPYFVVCTKVDQHIQNMRHDSPQMSTEKLLAQLMDSLLGQAGVPSPAVVEVTGSSVEYVNGRYFMGKPEGHRPQEGDLQNSVWKFRPGGWYGNPSQGLGNTGPTAGSEYSLRPGIAKGWQITSEKPERQPVIVGK